MKYFYQQLFGFVSVVLLTIAACGILFYNVMSNNVYTHYYSLRCRKEFHMQQSSTAQRIRTRRVADKSISWITTRYRQIYTLRPKPYELREDQQPRFFGEVS